MKARVLLCVALGCAACLVAPAHAVIAVIDAANLGQNTLTAARTLQEINNQVMQLQNEARMLLNQARNLTTLPFSIVAQLRATLHQTTLLLAQAQGIAFQLTQARAQFDAAYPMRYGGAVTGAAMRADTQLRWTHTQQALRTSVSMQAQAAQNLIADENALAQLVGQSQGAVGILQATQATNQLLALQSRQAIQEQQLRIAQDRSAALEHARVVAEQSRALEVRRRFVGNGLRYTPQPIGGFGF
jgi:P-type conjugative transfer protein TrbJ